MSNDRICPVMSRVVVMHESEPSPLAGQVNIVEMARPIPVPCTKECAWWDEVFGNCLAARWRPHNPHKVRTEEEANDEH